MGRKDEAKLEFARTNSLHKAADESIFKKLHEAQAKGKQVEGGASLPFEK
jgi:hypothetical protein